MIPTSHLLILSAVLFTIGTIGFLIRKNLLVVLMSIELILNAVNINLVTFSRDFASLNGQIFALFVITVTAAEVAVGLAIVVNMVRNRETVDTEKMNLMKW
jgi:NADH-quinone oxidoreductase subunit K